MSPRARPTTDQANGDGSRSRIPSTGGESQKSQRDAVRPALGRTELADAVGTEERDPFWPVVLLGEMPLPTARLKIGVAAALLAEENLAVLRLELVVYNPRYMRSRRRRRSGRNGPGARVWDFDSHVASCDDHDR